MAAPRIDFNNLPIGGKVFLGEGASEAGLLGALVRDLGIQNAAIFTVGGEKYLKTVLLRLAAETSGPEAIGSLGIVFDANNNYASKLDSVEAALRAAGFEFEKDKLDAHGIYRDGNLPIGVFLSPGMKRPGRIETMVMYEVEDSTISSCLNYYDKCVFEKAQRRLDEKGRVQTYLASFNAAVGLGIAFEKSLLNVGHTAYAEIRNMVLQLSEPV